MQQNKDKKFNKELKTFLKDNETPEDKLSEMTKLFQVKKSLSLFNEYKSKGYELSQLLTFLLLMPFYGAENIYVWVKSGIAPSNASSCKDAYYVSKNDERINWRLLLLIFAKRFRTLVNKRETLKKEGITAIIGDDTPIQKTGKKMENISLIHDHVTGNFIFGFKILVVGFWDGGSFIPLDFSIHREKGSQLEKARKTYRVAEKMLQNLHVKIAKACNVLKNKKERVLKHRSRVKEKPTNTNIKFFETAIASEKKAAIKVNKLKKEFAIRDTKLKELKTELKKVEKRYPAYGLSRKERQQQYKKKRTIVSSGYIRNKEADASKIEMFILMVLRALKNGFIPDYILTDSWFFCQDLLNTVEKMKKKGVRLLSMVKQDRRTYTLLPSGKIYNAHSLLKLYERQACYSRKIKAHYIKIPVLYGGIRVNLFFVKIGTKASWRLLITNDLNLAFLKMMEVYQIRWSIEVFFKECKQYLNLGGSHSSDFDGQIADATIAMLQHIMLTFFKRMNYQQSFGYLFKDISSEIIESTLAERLWEFFLEVIINICDILKIDIVEIYEEAMKNAEAMKLMKQLIYYKKEIKIAA